MKRIATCILSLVLAANAAAHDPVIHSEMSKNAVSRSRISDVTTLERLGLKSVPVDSKEQRFLNSATDSKSYRYTQLIVLVMLPVLRPLYALLTFGPRLPSTSWASPAS